MLPCETLTSENKRQSQTNDTINIHKHTYIQKYAILQHSLLRQPGKAANRKRSQRPTGEEWQRERSEVRSKVRGHGPDAVQREENYRERGRSWGQRSEVTDLAPSNGQRMTSALSLTTTTQCSGMMPSPSSWMSCSRPASGRPISVLSCSHVTNYVCK